MLEDVLLITEKHTTAANIIIKEILKKKKDKYVVAISGESGSGKSELTHVIARNLRNYGIVAKAIHVDNFYNTLPIERAFWRQKNGIENVVGLNEYDWDKINQTIDDFKHNKKSTMPCVDLVTEQVDELTTDFNGIDMLIIDGLYAINIDKTDIRILIELTYHETKKSQIDRGKELDTDLRRKILEQEHKVVESLKDKATIRISKEYKVILLSS